MSSGLQSIGQPLNVVVKWYLLGKKLPHQPLLKQSILRPSASSVQASHLQVPIFPPQVFFPHIVRRNSKFINSHRFNPVNSYVIVKPPKSLSNNLVVQSLPRIFFGQHLISRFDDPRSASSVVMCVSHPCVDDTHNPQFPIY